MARRVVAAVLTAGALLGSLAARLPPTAGSAPPVALAVVVHAGVPREALTREEVRRIFLLREQYWRDGTRVAPVNLASSSRQREAFSHAVLGRSTRDLARYWNDLYFHGTVPPPTLGSERAVLLYVARTPGGIGYVSRDSAMAAGVRVVLVLP